MFKNITKKITIIIITLFICIVLGSCSKQTTVTLHVFGDEIYTIDSNTNENYELPTIENRKGYVFQGWYDNINCSGERLTSVKVSGDLHVYAKWQAIENYKIVYVSLITGEEQVSKEYEYYKEDAFQYLLEQPFIYNDRKIAGYSFKPNGDINVTDRITIEQVVHYADSLGIVKLYSIWGGPFTINYLSSDGEFIDKFAMRTAYYTDFYTFILTREGGREHLEKNGIYTCADFISLATDWKGGGGNEMTGIGNIAGHYYLFIEVGGKLEDQPDTHFIGYCYQNNKWVELIEFLMVFFAYWRTDEGYTGGPSDPNNTGNDFFASAWASLVDTAKMFYFTSETLTDKYAWFTEQRSPRVHKALDNVPGCYNLNYLVKTIDTQNVVLPTPSIEGKKFRGWFYNDEGIGTPITVIEASKVKSEITVYAVWD